VNLLTAQAQTTENHRKGLKNAWKVAFFIGEFYLILNSMFLALVLWKVDTNIIAAYLYYNDYVLYLLVMSLIYSKSSTIGVYYYYYYWYLLYVLLSPRIREDRWAVTEGSQERLRAYQAWRTLWGMIGCRRKRLSTIGV
jgi:hypothetical protein